MDNKHLTVLIIGTDDEEVKSYKINANLYHNIIRNYRKYMYGAASVLGVFLIIIISMFFFSVKQTVDKSGLNSRLVEVNNMLETYDSLKLQQKLNKIDNNLSMIDAYLQSRGLMETENAGGEPGSERKISNIGKIEFFEQQSEVFYKNLKDLPIGYPYYGARSSDYGYRRNPFGGYSGEFHAGVDIKGPLGDAIYATGDGVVNRCDYYGGYGNAVVIDHKFGLQSLYGHMSRVNVVQGQQVKAGDLIGFLGSTGRSTGPHLHYEIRKNGEDIDPEPFLKLN